MVHLKRRTRGFALLELLGALAVASVLMIGLAMMINASLEDARAAQAAQYQARMTAAATQELRQNYQVWLQRAGTTTPSVMSLATLQADGFLPASVQPKNAYGQTSCVLVLKEANGVALDALALTEGGESIGDAELGFIAANSGQGGGSITARQPTQAIGAYQSWMVPVSTFIPSGSNIKCASSDAAPPNAGHLASEIFYNGPGTQINSDYLYRVGVNGHPEANAMQVPIWLENTYVEGEVDATNCGVTGNYANGKIAADVYGHLLSCKSGTWRGASGQWRDPVANAASLPGSGAASPNQVGDVRLTLDTLRAFAWTGTGWQALAIDSNGDLVVPGAVVAKTLEVSTPVVINTACSPDPNNPTAGQISMGASGQVLSCQNGTWLPQSGITMGATDNDCTILMATPGATDYAQCSSVYPGPYPNSPTVTYANDGTYTYVIKRPVTLNNNGLIAVSAYMHISYSMCNKSGWQGQIQLIADIIDNQSGQSIAHGEAQSTTITDDSTTVNISLNQAATPRKGYSVVLQSNWATYSGPGSPWTSNFCGNNGKLIDQTPLATGWTISAFY
jgi:type II secretory pathway pseudopilin PulG